MLEMFKSFFSSGKQAREEQRQAEILERLLSNDDPTELLRWCDKNARKIDQRLVTTLMAVSTHLLSQTSIASTQQLFRLDLIMNEFFQRSRGKSWPVELVLLQKTVEESAVGPRPLVIKEPADMHKRVYNYRGCCLAEHGEYSASIEHFNATLEIDPQFAPAYCNRARAYMALDRWEEAWADCEMLRSFDPDYPEGQATCQLVGTLRRLKASRKGSLVKIAEEHGLLELLWHYDRPLKPGEYAANLGRQINPLEIPRVSETDATPEELNHLGVVRGRSGDYAGAIEALNQALELKPEYEDAYYNRGKAYLLAGDYEKAIADFSFLLERNPRDTEVYELRKQAYEKWERELRSGDTSVDMASPKRTDRNVRGEEQGEQGIDTLLVQSGKQGHLEAKLLQPPEEVGELAYVGPSAPLRPQVITEARNLLFPEGLDVSRTGANADMELTAEDLYNRATISRKRNKHEEALSFYRSALTFYMKFNQLEGISACLNGLGLSYQALLKEAVRQKVMAFAAAKPWASGARSLIAFSYQLYQEVYQPVSNLAEKGRACHRWSLELHKEMNNLAGQANQISNLALIEEFLGNLDTARRYQLWALQVHREVGKQADAVIDLINLAHLERSLGNEEAAATWERQSQEGRHATQS